MKLFILHLSDIHFEKENDYNDSNVTGIVNALKIDKEVEAVLVVVSGDITYSGYRRQYSIGWNFFYAIRDRIRKKYGIKHIEFGVVPGNHDINYKVGELSHDQIKEYVDKDLLDENIEKECSKMSAFYYYASELQCFQKKNRLVSVRIIQYGDKSIRLNLINTAAFSSLDEDQGLHYLPKIDMELLNSDSESDYVFTVMHHPHHWFCWRMKKELEKVIYEKSDVIYVGHEHYSSEMDISSHCASVRIYAGGELSNRGNWDNSEFYCAVLNTDTRMYEVSHFTWDSKTAIYIKRNSNNSVLSRNRIGKSGISPKKEYISVLMQDTKYMICEDVSDYYVFPLMEEIISNDRRIGREISDSDKFIDEIEDKKKIIIAGRSNAGKTMLVRQIYKIMSGKRYVLYIHACDIKGGKYEQIVKNIFEDSYSEDYVEYEKFKQSNPGNKVIIVEDVDEIDSSIYESFLKYLGGEFEIIIQTSSKAVELDIKERIKQSALIEPYTMYKIAPFYADKRKELVTSIVKILVNQNEDAQGRIVTLLCDALSKQRNLFNMDPDFIVQFAKYYCSNIGETIQNDGSIFSKVFESNIVSLLKPNAVRISVDKILIILDKIAYQMHVAKNYPMSQDDIYAVIKQYNDDFDSEVDYVDFIEILLKSRIFEKDGVKYAFTERNYLAYFVAREIKRRCLEEQDYEEFNRALDFACFNINADILLFVTYITDNLNIIKMIMGKVEEYSEQWTEFTMSPISIPYLSDTNQLTVIKVEEGDRQKTEIDIVEHEKQQEKTKEIVSRNAPVYNYDEDDLTLMEKMIRAISLSIILSRTLPCFEHMMKKADKEKCVRLIYSMPLKIFNVWATQVEEAKTDLIQEIKGLHEWQYRKEKTSLDDHDVLNYLRWESVSLLMELMNVSMGNATKQNTLRYIDAFDYSEKAIYEIEHLMSLDKRDSVSEFMCEAEALYEKQRQSLAKLMVQRVAKHFMLTSKKIQRTNVQRLNSKLWDGQLKSTDLLVQKNRNNKREK